MKTMNKHRFKDNPVEKQMATEWELQTSYGDTLGWILSEDKQSPQHTTPREQMIAASVIQWIGSPVGQAFLEEALCIPDLRKQIYGALELQRQRRELLETSK